MSETLEHKTVMHWSTFHILNHVDIYEDMEANNINFPAKLQAYFHLFNMQQLFNSRTSMPFYKNTSD